MDKYLGMVIIAVICIIIAVSVYFIVKNIQGYTPPKLKKFDLVEYVKKTKDRYKGPTKTQILLHNKLSEDKSRDVKALRFTKKRGNYDYPIAPAVPTATPTMIIRNHVRVPQPLKQLEVLRAPGDLELDSNGLIKINDVPAIPPEEMQRVVATRLDQCNLTKSFYLPSLNIEDPASFIKGGINVFPDLLPLGEPDENGVRKIVKTRSFSNPFIRFSPQINSLTGNYSYCKSTLEIMEKVSTKVEATVGGSYAALTVQATCSVLVGSTFNYESTYQAYNITVEKVTNCFYLENDLFAEDFLKPELMEELVLLGDTRKNALNPIIMVKDNPDQTEDRTDVHGHNMHIEPTAWYQCKLFFQKWGSHILTSINFGKKVNIWDTIKTESSEKENVLEIKACLTLSYGGWTPCTIPGLSKSLKPSLVEGLDGDVVSDADKASSDMRNGNKIEEGIVYIISKYENGDNSKSRKVSSYVAKVIPNGGQVICKKDSKSPGGWKCEFSETEFEYLDQYPSKKGEIPDYPPHPPSAPSGAIPAAPQKQAEAENKEVKDNSEQVVNTETTDSSSGGGGASAQGTCTSGKECVGYQPYIPADPADPYGQSQMEQKGQCQPKGSGQKVGFNVGVQACASHKEESKTTKTNNSSVMKIFVTGGDDKSQSDLLVEKMSGQPGISGDKLEEFLKSDPRLDTPIDFTFLPIWKIFIDLYYAKCKGKIVGMSEYKINRLATGYTARVIDNKKEPNNDLLESIKRKIPVNEIVGGRSWRFLYTDSGDVNNPSWASMALGEYATEKVPIPQGSTKTLLKNADFRSSTLFTYAIMIGDSTITNADLPDLQSVTLSHYFYYDETSKTNTVELFVPSTSVKKYYDPCLLYQGALNLEAAYIADTVCPPKIHPNYGFYQKMVAVPWTTYQKGYETQVPGGEEVEVWNEVATDLQTYACWNKATGCQESVDCTGVQLDHRKCGPNPWDSCHNVTSLCTQGGLWYDPVMDARINKPGSDKTSYNYRTVADRPPGVSAVGKTERTTGASDTAEPGPEADTIVGFKGQYSCSGLGARNSNKFENGDYVKIESRASNSPWWWYGQRDTLCACQNPYTVRSKENRIKEYLSLPPHIKLELVKRSGNAKNPETDKEDIKFVREYIDKLVPPPAPGTNDNILDDRFVWDQKNQ